MSEEGSSASHKLLCFVIAPIGEPESDVRKKSDQVLKYLIKRSLGSKYLVERADQIGRPGIITFQIVQRIFDADLVIADLSDHNPNVYYELAIRHATRKPAIHIVSRGQDIPFDVQDMRFVPYDLSNPDSIEEACEQLSRNVEAIEKGEKITTPVQIAGILQSLKAGEDRDAQIQALFESLNTGMSNLQEGIGEVVNDLRQRKLRESWAPVMGSSEPMTALTSILTTPASGFHFPSSSHSVFERAAEIAKKAEAVIKAKEGKESKGSK